MDDHIISKQCSKCKQNKPLEQFYKNRAQKKDGLQTYCIDCSKAKAINYYWAHRNTRLEKQRQYKQTHKELCRTHNKSNRSTIRGHLGHIWRHINSRCTNPKDKRYYCYGERGIQLHFACFEDFFNYVTKELKIDPRGLTIDRIDNNGHYEPGNIRFVTRAENNANGRRWRKR